jgi:hypothetical protein
MRNGILVFAHDGHDVTFLRFEEFRDPDFAGPLNSTSSSMYAAKGATPLNTRLEH